MSGGSYVSAGDVENSTVISLVSGGVDAILTRLQSKMLTQHFDLILDKLLVIDTLKSGHYFAN